MSETPASVCIGGFTEYFGRRRRLAVFCCVVWNAVVALSIVWFIVSIEMTIRWNHIQGVNTIESTGQLLPTVLGAVSLSRTLKRLVLFALGKVLPLMPSRPWLNFIR